MYHSLLINSSLSVSLTKSITSCQPISSSLNWLTQVINVLIILRTPMLSIKKYVRPSRKWDGGCYGCIYHPSVERNCVRLCSGRSVSAVFGRTLGRSANVTHPRQARFSNIHAAALIINMVGHLLRRCRSPDSNVHSIVEDRIQK